MQTNRVMIKKLFIHQPHKVVKHTQAIQRQKPTNCVSMSDHFVRLALKELSMSLTTKINQIFNFKYIINQESLLKTSIYDKAC